METLPIWMLGITTAVPLFLVWLGRGYLQDKLINGLPESRQVRRQFMLDLTLPVVGGLIVIAFNRMIHQFPILSGVSFVFGWLVFGFFIGLDMALDRERALIMNAGKGTETWQSPQKLYPMTHKFSMVASAAAVFVVIVLAMAVARDFAWLAQADRTADALSKAQQSVIVEILFVMTIMLGLVANLIFSYSRNLRMLFRNETIVLENVSNGDLTKMVPVVTNDEFGYIAGHTNTMIDGLRHRSELISSLKLAAEVQRSLLPHKPPQYPGVDMSGISLYCDQTGGDYYDFLNLPDQRLGIVVADSAGHGVGSALHMTTARAFMKFGAAHYQDVVTFIGRVNRYLSADSQDTSRFVAAFFLELDYANRSMRWIRAGNEPALVFDPADGSTSTLSGEGLVLGVNPAYSYQESGNSLWKPGLVIVIATDGIREYRNPDDEMYGLERMQTVIAQNAHGTAEDIQNVLIDDLKRFTRGAPQDDDVTLVVVKLGG